MSRTVELEVVQVPQWQGKPWGWHVKINPDCLQPNINRSTLPMHGWCARQWGLRGHQWDRVAHNFLFHTSEHAMMFKLAWHNVEL